jgi:predicted phage terminase large subunit-like protein
MPAIAETEKRTFPATCTVEPDGRQPGEALCPERYNAGKLAQIRGEIGGYFWAALYQQRPAPREGGYFKRGWFPIVGALPHNCRQYVRYWDKAATPDGGAHTAGVLMACGPDNEFYVVDVVRGQWSVGEREAVIEQTAHLDTQRRFGATYQVWVEQEPGSGGKESAEATIKRLAGYAAYKEPVTGSKELRAEPFAAQAEVGNIRLLEGAWNADYIEELSSFPHGAYKDQVDASSGAFNKLAVQEQTFVARYR